MDLRLKFLATVALVAAIGANVAVAEDVCGELIEIDEEGEEMTLL